MFRIRRVLLSLVLVALAALALPGLALAATTTAETGPITTHVPQTYVYNLGPNDDGQYRELTNKTTGEHIAWGIDNGKCPILLPGDTLEVVPEPNTPNSAMSKGFALASNENYPNATHYESRGPIEVVRTATWGGYPFITEIKIRGSYPVLVWSNGGGDRSSERISDEVSYTYSASDLDFRWFPASVNVTYEFYDSHNRSFLTSDQLEELGLSYYTNETNPTVFYAEDALVNLYAESNQTLGLDVYRPYLEGYRFEGYSGDQYRRGSSTTDSSYRENLSQIYARRHSETDSTDRTIFYPQWAVSSYNNQVMNGNEDDTVFITYKFNTERTITLDAMGGTIDGYPSRIYEAPGGGIETQMDEDFANGAYTPVRKGYVFDGWYLDPECTEPMTSFHDVLKSGDVEWPIMSSYPLELRAKHVYAKWKAATTDISKAEVTGLSKKTYTGKAITQSPVVSYNGVKLTQGTDYTVSFKNNTNAGTATVTITGKGNYTGTKKATFTIAKADLSSATIADIADQGYTGSAIKPSPAVKLSGNTLKSGTDYTLSYKSNTKVGTATVTATGKGNYTGSKSKTFKIVNWSGASKIPVNAKAKYTCLKDGYLRVKASGKNAKSNDILSISGWNITGKKAGKTTLYLFDKSGKQIATKTVEVYTISGKTYEFESSVDKNFVLDIQGGSKKDGAQMIVYERNGGDNQKYQFYLQKDGTYGIRSKKSSKWLTVETTNNKFVQQWAWKGGGTQTWTLTVDASNRVTFINVGTKKCFDVQGGKTKNSAKMIVWESNGGLNQKWKLNQK